MIGFVNRFSLLLRKWEGNFCIYTDVMPNFGKTQEPLIQKLMKLKQATQATILLFIIFFIDLIVPLGIAVGIFYLCGFLLVCKQEKKIIIIFAILSSVLTILKFLIFVSIETNYFVYLNRSITIGIIWVIAILAIRHRRLVEQMNIQRAAYIKELEEMLFITSHEVRRPISSCLGLMNLVENDKPLSQNELWQIIEHLKASALELDTFTKKLTTFLHEIGQRRKV